MCSDRLPIPEHRIYLLQGAPRIGSSIKNEIINYCRIEYSAHPQ
jgi:hypothetical protein